MFNYTISVISCQEECYFIVLLGADTEVARFHMEYFDELTVREFVHQLNDSQV